MSSRPGAWHEGTRRRDLGLKQRLYDRVGIREYWLVDPDDRTVTICRRSLDGAFAEDAPLGDAGVIRSAALPGFSLRLDQLFQ